MRRIFILFAAIGVMISCSSPSLLAPNTTLGKFNSSNDLLISNFDSKPDVDDLHAIAALSTLLKNADYGDVRYVAVAGAYGQQGGDYIDAPRLFELAFGDNWLDAHTHREKTIQSLAERTIDVLDLGGVVWVQEAGQSDLSADIIMAVRRLRPDLDTANRFRVIQHSEWNESVTSPEKLQLLKTFADYKRIPDGNLIDNGTPGFVTDDPGFWPTLLQHPIVGSIWAEAKTIADERNPNSAYINPSIAKGGLDFSDTAELAYIFGFEDMQGVEDFIARFASYQRPNTSLANSAAMFEWFEYTGQDPVLSQIVPEGYFLNPILTGFYPDPSIVRVGDDYYMTHSTFGFYPGLPVFHSRDLVNWTQIGNAVNRPDMMDFDGIHLGWNGLYAPTIDYHEGVFYIINTCVGCGGDFILTAKDPAGPWSDPVWIADLADVRGIDTQMFWEDERLFILNHEGPEGPELYDGHRAIWIREVNPDSYEIIGKKRMIIDGGVNHLIEKPGYVEGPHLYRVGDYYYVSAPEGGTGMDHRQTIWRARDIFGPYEPYENNPILTQRGLPDDRANPITSTGHADMVETQTGDWWAVFLGTRTYDTIHFATGRETFLLPVTWTDDGWPVILEAGREVPYILPRPNLPPEKQPPRPIAGNFTIRDEFDSALENYWSFARIPKTQWWRSSNGQLLLSPRADRLGDGGTPSIIARRLHHMHAQASTKVVFDPNESGDEAGLIVFQNDDFYYAFGLGLNAVGEQVLRLRQRDGANVHVAGRTLKETKLRLAAGAPVYLKFAINRGDVAFHYSLDGESYTEFASNLDAKMLGSMKAGGFTGAFLGMYAETGDLRENHTIQAVDLADGVIAPSTAITSGYGSGQTHGMAGAPGLSIAEQALRLVVQSKQANIWDAGVSGGNLPGKISTGDVITISLWARFESGPGFVEVNVQQGLAPYTSLIRQTLELSDVWQRYEITGIAPFDLAAGEASLAIHAGHAEQILHFGPFDVQKSP